MSAAPSRVRRRCKRLAVIFAGLVITPLALFQAAVLWWPGAPVRDGRPQAQATIILDRYGDEVAVLTAVDGQFHLPLSRNDTGPWLGNAVIAVEDSRFYEHGGVDWKSVLGSAWEDLSSRHVHRGASTIPMQLVHLRDPQPRSVLGKLVQAVRAAQLTRNASRDEILLDYLNRAPFGGNLVGAAAASWRYFNKPCSKLTLAEAATLAGLPQSPNRYRPDRFPQLAKSRRNHVLDRMLACGMITVAQHDGASVEPLIASWRPLPQELPDAPASLLMPTLAQLVVGRPGGEIQTTIDPDVQKTVADITALRGGDLPTSLTRVALAVVVLDTQSAQCLAAINTGPEAGQLDLIHSRRSTGSVLKPFIYALAFQEGICGPDTLTLDGPQRWADYAPQNFDRTFRGQLTVREALAQSRNIPAMDLLARVGVAPACQVLAQLGVSRADNPDRYGLTLAVGGAEASPFEIAGAFATLGRRGWYRAPTLEAKPGAAASDAVRLLSPLCCSQVLSALSDPQRTSVISPQAARLHAAWKTGTSSGQRDAWCAAVTAANTVVVWTGNPDSSGDAALVGAQATAPLALAILSAIQPDNSSITDPADGSKSQRTDPIELPRPIQSFKIISPRPDQQIIIDPTVPLQNQRLQLRVQNGANQQVYWFVDASPLAAQDQKSLESWWEPLPGSHIIRAVTPDGKAATARITVRDAADPAD